MGQKAGAGSQFFLSWRGGRGGGGAEKSQVRRTPPPPALAPETARISFAREAKLSFGSVANLKR